MDNVACNTFLQPCPCGTGYLYSQCCAPYCTGQAQPPTAESLMRSRYTAFTQGNIDYLIQTHHPTRRGPDQRRQLGQSIQSTVWQGLRVLSTEQGQWEDREGVVEFIAYYADPKPGQIHERSRFVKQKNRWLYLDGDSLKPVWPHRNDPCWCGNGKKFKLCHGQ